LKSEAAIVRGVLQGLLGNKFQSFLSFKSAYSWFKRAKAKIDIIRAKSISFDSEFDTIT
jgi:hypothetical protein